MCTCMLHTIHIYKHVHTYMKPHTHTHMHTPTYTLPTSLHPHPIHLHFVPIHIHPRRSVSSWPHPHPHFFQSSSDHSLIHPLHPSRLLAPLSSLLLPRLIHSSLLSAPRRLTLSITHLQYPRGVLIAILPYSSVFL